MEPKKRDLKKRRHRWRLPDWKDYPDYLRPEALAEAIARMGEDAEAEWRRKLSEAGKKGGSRWAEIRRQRAAAEEAERRKAAEERRAGRAERLGNDTWKRERGDRGLSTTELVLWRMDPGAWYAAEDLRAICEAWGVPYKALRATLKQRLVDAGLLERVVDPDERKAQVPGVTVDRYLYRLTGDGEARRNEIVWRRGLDML